MTMLHVTLPSLYTSKLMKYKVYTHPISFIPLTLIQLYFELFFRLDCKPLWVFCKIKMTCNFSVCVCGLRLAHHHIFVCDYIVI